VSDDRYSYRWIATNGGPIRMDGKEWRDAGKPFGETDLGYVLRSAINTALVYANIRRVDIRKNRKPLASVEYRDDDRVEIEFASTDWTV